MLPKLEPDVLGMGVGLGVGVGVGVGEDSMDAGGPPSVGSTEAQPVLSNTQTPVSSKKVGLTVKLFAYQIVTCCIFIFFTLFLFKEICQHTLCFCTIEFSFSNIRSKIGCVLLEGIQAIFVRIQ